MDPILLILAGVAAFILFRLFSVLGTRTGHEQRHDLEALRRKAPSSDAQNETDEDMRRDREAPPKPVSTNARLLREADPEFDEQAFLNGASSAYEMIVEAFTAGDLHSIRAYLGDTVYEAFKSAIAARNEAGHMADLKFVGIDHAAIVDSSVDDGWMKAVTEFSSNQVRVTRDKDGNVIDGDPNRIDLQARKPRSKLDSCSDGRRRVDSPAQ